MSALIDLKACLTTLLMIFLASTLNPISLHASTIKSFKKKSDKILKDWKKESQELKTSSDKLFSENASLSDYLKVASFNNPGVKSSFYNWKSSLEKIQNAKSFPDPRFSYAYYLQEVETRVGPQKQKFSISQMFPWWGTLRAKGKASLQESEKHRFHFQSELNQTIFKVKSIYWDYYFLGKATEIYGSILQLLQQMEQVAQVQYSAGKIPQGPILRMQIEIGKTKDALFSLAEKKIWLDQELKSRLNIDDPRILPFPKVLISQLPDIDKEDLWVRILKSNPNLKMMEKAITKSQIEMNLAKKKYFPNLMVGLSYIQTDESPMSVTDNGKDPIILGASINIPFQWGSLNSSVKQKKNQTLQNKFARNEMENNLQSQLSKILFQLKDAKRQWILYEKSLVPKAKETLASFGVSFRAGKAKYLDIIDSEKTLLKFSLIKEQSLSHYFKGLAQLDLLVGEAE